MFFTILIITLFVGIFSWYFFLRSKPMEMEIEPMEMEIEPMVEKNPEPVKEPPKVKKKPEKPNFMISSQWDGERSGYVFKSGDKGVGYYRDRPRVSFGNNEVVPYSPQESPEQTGLRYKKLV
jgi:hypothetical protein